MGMQHDKLDFKKDMNQAKEITTLSDQFRGAQTDKINELKKSTDRLGLM